MLYFFTLCDQQQEKYFHMSQEVVISYSISIFHKGQLISKCPFGVFKSPKKKT